MKTCLIYVLSYSRLKKNKEKKSPRMIQFEEATIFDLELEQFASSCTKEVNRETTSCTRQFLGELTSSDFWSCVDMNSMGPETSRGKHGIKISDTSILFLVIVLVFRTRL